MLTIFIPTLNRSDFIIRMLRYYAATNYKDWIYIGDSSAPSHVKKVKDAIKELEGKLKIAHYDCSGMSASACVKYLTERIETPYAVFLADDDLIVTNGLKDCVEFLEKNNDYTGANGKSFLFSLKNQGAFGEFLYAADYGMGSVEKDSAKERFVWFLLNYFPVLFSVQRTKVWKKIYRDVLSVPDVSFGGEFIPSCLSVIEGKIKHLDCLYVARQMHTQRYLTADFFDVFTGPDWNPSYRIFYDSVVDALAIHGSTKEEARETVKKIFWLHMSRTMRRKYQTVYARDSQLLRKIKSRLFVRKNIILPRLLKHSSRYYADFMPLYEVVSGKLP